MNVVEAITHLNKTQGSWIHSIEKIGKNLYKMSFSQGNREDEILSAREIIKFARVFSSESKRNTTMKSNVKKFDNDKNRTATRDAIATEEFDKIPQNGKTNQDSLWNWD